MSLRSSAASRGVALGKPDSGLLQVVFQGQAFCCMGEQAQFGAAPQDVVRGDRPFVATQVVHLHAEQPASQPAAGVPDLDRVRPTECVQKYGGRLWATTFDHSPLDVVAWHGNLAPCRYDTARFNTINTVSYDHPDPSIFTVLTSPSETPGTANIDFVIFPPRWMVAEDTFRPPWFHRNVMSEFMGLVTGAYDAKAGGFAPGGASLHNRMSGHGPDQASYDGAIKAELKPHKIENTLAFMFETRMPIRVTKWASESPQMQLDYDDVWSGFTKGQIS